MPCLEPRRSPSRKPPPSQAGQHHGASIAGRPVHPGRRGRYLGADRGHGPADPVQLAAVIGVRLAGAEVSVRAQPGHRVERQVWAFAAPSGNAWSCKRANGHRRGRADPPLAMTALVYGAVVALEMSLLPKFAGQSASGHGAGNTR